MVLLDVTGDIIGAILWWIIISIVFVFYWVFKKITSSTINKTRILYTFILLLMIIIPIGLFKYIQISKHNDIEITFQKELYKGNLEENKYHGYGKLIIGEIEYMDARNRGWWQMGIYEGDFKNGRTFGKGKLTTTIGSSYEKLDLDEFPSFNIDTSNGVMVYEGIFKGGVDLAFNIIDYETDILFDYLARKYAFPRNFFENLIVEDARIQLPEKEIFCENYFFESNYNEGVIVFKNGNIYKGKFKVEDWNNVLNKLCFFVCDGEGKMTYADGTVKEGLWKEGEFIGE